MSKIQLFSIVVLLGLQLTIVNGANIMFYFGLGAFSHKVAGWPIAVALADLGHNVTFLSTSNPWPEPHPGVREYFPPAFKAWTISSNGSGSFYSMRVNKQMDGEWYSFFDWGVGSCEVLTGDEDFQQFIRNSPPFDLIIVDALVNECAYGIAHFFKAKLIVYNTANAFPWYVDAFGLPDESSWVSDIVYHFPPATLSFMERAYGLFHPLYFKYLRETRMFPKLEAILRKSLTPDLPPLVDIEKNVSLLFINHHPAEDYPRPLPPNIVPISGTHITNKDQPLPKDMEEFLSDTPEGFIYMSFGTYAQLSDFPEEIRNVFINTFQKLKNKKINVIWKMNVERPHGLSDNVLTAKWVPQQTLLAHPKIRGFISHGGLLGIQEAIWNAVPLIIFPIFAEQDSNGEKIAWREIGINLEISKVTEKELQDSLEKILNDGRYSKNMKRVSKIFRDRQIHPVDNAVWWIEYVLRHDDTTALRPLSLNQPWWKKRQLDIWACVFITLFITLLTICFVLKCIFRIGTKTQPSNSSKKKLKRS